jgi:hypothetical protein
MTRRVLGLVAAGLMLAGVAACDSGRLSDHVTVTELEPQSVGLPPKGADPHYIRVMVRWTKDGWCSGQFTVQATETSTEVRVGNVISREPDGDCPGLGADNNTAWVDLELAAPLGDRIIIRDSDGARLPSTRLG